MRKKTKTALGAAIAAILVLGAAGACAYFLRDRIFEPVEDDSRVSITMKGTSPEGTYTSLYVWCTHPDIPEDIGKTEPLGSIWGISPYSAYQIESPFVEKAGEDTYRVELTGLLPLGYGSFSDFLEDGGKMGVIVSYDAKDLSNRVQSADLYVEKAGDHVLGLPTYNKEEISDEVTPWMSNGELFAEETESSAEAGTESESGAA